MSLVCSHVAMFRAVLCVVAPLACSAISGPQGSGDPVNGYPSWQERSILVLTNACRLDPTGYRDRYVGAYSILNPANYPAVGPVYWNLELNQVSRSHARDMAGDCGMQHNSCDGTSFLQRVGSAYTKSGTIGENIATGYSDPIRTMNQWIMDGDPPAPDRSANDGHRRNIMNGAYHEMGAGYAYGSVRWNHFWVQDFGGGQAGILHPVVAGTHLLAETGKTKFMAVYFDRSKAAPQKACLVLNGDSSSMILELGAADSGVYVVSLNRGSVCRDYRFVFRDGQGKTWLYPENGSLITVGEGSCANEYTGIPPDNGTGQIVSRQYGNSEVRIWDLHGKRVAVPRHMGLYFTSSVDGDGRTKIERQLILK